MILVLKPISSNVSDGTPWERCREVSAGRDVRQYEAALNELLFPGNAADRQTKTDEVGQGCVQFEG